MAASSPLAISSSAVADSSGVGSVLNGHVDRTPKSVGAFDMPRTNLRGHNKPICVQCGNMARSRCPFQCCKSCCYKAQNPCNVHVLKQSPNVPEKATPPPVEQSPNPEIANGPSWRLSCLRQIPYNALSELRTRRFTINKDAETSKWRFMKLKEHINGNVEVENEAFDRYMLNVSLLEEVFTVPNDHDGAANPPDERTEANEAEKSICDMKVRVRSDSSKDIKRRIGLSLSQKLKKLKEHEDNPSTFFTAQDGFSLPVSKQRAEITAWMGKLHDKLNKATCEDDLNSCFETASSSGDSFGKLMQAISSKFRPPTNPTWRMYTKKEIDEETISKVNAEFCCGSDNLVQL